MNDKQFEIDNITYTMRPANAIRAWNALKKAGGLFKGVDIGQGEDDVKSHAVGAILSNLGEPSVKDIEDLVFEHTTVTIDGKTYKLSSQLNEHFNQYRSHMAEVLIQGAIYQFEDFFKGGMSSIQRLMPTATEKQVSTGLSTDQ